MHFATEAEYYDWARALTAALRRAEAESLVEQKDVTTGALRTSDLPDRALRHGAPLPLRSRSFVSNRRARR